MEKKKFKINLHLVFAIFVVLTIAIFVGKFWGFGRVITPEDVATIPAPENAEIQSYDDFLPLPMEDDGTFPADDEVTTVVCFGNNPFSDDRDSKDNLCNLFSEETGAAVYNCAVSGSFMTSYLEDFRYDIFPLDAFSFCRVVNAMAQNDYSQMEDGIGMLNAVDYDTTEIEKAVKVMQTVDFEKVDAIFIMYDGNDYLSGRKLHNAENLSDVTAFSGSLSVGIQTLQEAYPWIRIIVMSPTYAYGLDVSGNHVRSDVMNYGQGSLANYLFQEADTASRASVSFLDTMYGAIHEDVAPNYLSDHLHLNVEGRKLLVPRMIEALEKYTTIY